MIKTEIIDNIEGVMSLIAEQTYNNEIDRFRSSYFFRGMPDVNYKLITSLRRNCKQLQKQLEPHMLKNFTKYASLDNPTLSTSVWKQMMVGQHHGLPTRLLDWTRSPLIALHFANSGINPDKIAKRDCVVWRFDMKDVNKYLPDKYKEVLERNKTYVFTIDTLGQVVQSLEEYDWDMQDKAFVNIEPPSIDQRIINQYSFFSIIPNGIEDIEEYMDKYTTSTVKYIIKSDIRWQVRDLLDQYNINERIIYPGLDGLSMSLARHYFVK